MRIAEVASAMARTKVSRVTDGSKSIGAIPKAPQGIARRRLGDGQVSGRAGEVAFRHHLVEDPQKVQVERQEVHVHPMISGE
jgi:hypothetical protein